MTVRSTKLVVTTLNVSATDTLLYTVPAGVRTLVKGLRLTSSGAARVELKVKNGGVGFAHEVGNYVMPSSDFTINEILFMVLNVGDQILIRSSTSANIGVALGGAELAL